MKEVTINQFLTHEQIARCVKLYAQLADTGKFARTVAEEVIKPNLAEINRKLGQENDPMYLAYAVEYTMLRSRQ